MSNWQNPMDLPSQEWRCGYCGNDVANDKGYVKINPGGGASMIGAVYLCPHCDNPTFFAIDEWSQEEEQTPGAKYGDDVSGLPKDVSTLYDEIRQCCQDGSYTASVLESRKMLMHVAVSCGAGTNLSFAAYVDYLADKGYIPPNGREWVDEIRKGGNEANHEITITSKDDAIQLLDFVEMLLKFVYEFPSRLKHSK